MFRHLSTFSHTRTRKEAIGFYLAYLLLGVLIGGIAALVLTPQTGDAEFTAMRAGEIGRMVGPLYSLTLGLLVFLKHPRKTYLNFLLVLASGVLGYLGGAILGLLPIAYLTTRK